MAEVQTPKPKSPCRVISLLKPSLFPSLPFFPSFFLFSLLFALFPFFSLIRAGSSSSCSSSSCSSSSCSSSSCSSSSCSSSSCICPSFRGQGPEKKGRKRNSPAGGIMIYRHPTHRQVSYTLSMSMFFTGALLACIGGFTPLKTSRLNFPAGGWDDKWLPTGRRVCYDQSSHRARPRASRACPGALRARVPARSARCARCARAPRALRAREARGTSKTRTVRGGGWAWALLHIART